MPSAASRTREALPQTNKPRTPSDGCSHFRCGGRRALLRWHPSELLVLLVTLPDAPSWFDPPKIRFDGRLALLD